MLYIFIKYKNIFINIKKNFPLSPLNDYIPLLIYYLKLLLINYFHDARNKMQNIKNLGIINMVKKYILLVVPIKEKMEEKKEFLKLKLAVNVVTIDVRFSTMLNRPQNPN